MTFPFKKVSETNTQTKTNLAQQILGSDFNRNQEEPEPVVIPTQQELLANLADEINNPEQYNTVLDTQLYRNTGKVVNRESIRALKNSNRFDALQNKEDIENLKDAFKRGMSKSSWAATYDPEFHNEMHIFLLNHFGRSTESIVASEYASLKDLEQLLLEREANVIITAAEIEINRDEQNVPEDIELRLVTEAINLYEDSFRNLGENDVSVSSVLALGYSSLLDAESQNKAVIATLSKMDEETSYIEAVLNRDLNEPLNVTVAGRPRSYSFSEIWENCFDCFSNTWNGDKDFKFGLEVELRLKEVIKSIRTVIDGIKLAIDIPGQVEANVCSLLNLGVLCPIEMAFLIASLISLARFVITENILGFKGFLSQLIGTILNPLFGALSTGINSTVGPLNGYIDCVFETILTQRQVQQVTDPLVAITRARINSRQLDLGQALKIPGLDPMDLAMTGLGEFEQRMNNARDWILGSIESLRIWASSNSIQRTDLFAKIIALSALISVLIAISNFITNDVEVCQEVTDPETGQTIVVPRFEAEEFLGMIDLAPFSEIEIPTQNIDGIPVPNLPAIINTETGSRFTIVNCAKGKSNTVSNLEAQRLLRQLGFN